MLLQGHNWLTKKNSQYQHRLHHIFYFTVHIVSKKWSCHKLHKLISQPYWETCTWRDGLINKVNGLVQERRNSSALALELHLSCTKPSKWVPVFVFLKK